MVYVPRITRPTRYQVQLETGIKSGSGWNVNYISTSASNRNDYTSIYGSKGKKSKYAWGWWSPTRGYTRLGCTVKFAGSRMTSGNGQNRMKSSQYATQYGFPAWGGSPPRGTEVLRTGNCSLLNGSGYPVLSANTRNRLITECILKVGDRKANYGEALAEGRKTLAHLAHTSSSVVRALLALRRGRFRDFARALGISNRRGWISSEMSKRWLEYQYAWLPLLGDIFDTYNVLKDGIDRNTLVIRGVRQLSDSAEVRLPIYHGISGAALKGEGKVRHTCILFYRLTNSTSDAFYRLGLINPFEVAWAVVPFSFVVDWFLPVANVLEAYSALQGLTFVDGCISSKFEGSASGLYVGAYTVGWYYWPEESDMTCSVSQYSFVREKISSAPNPALYIKSPFSSKHTVSALALLRQLWR